MGFNRIFLVSCIGAGLSTLVLLRPLLAASFTLDGWSLRTQVEDTSTDEYEYMASRTVQPSPFQASQFVSINDGVTTGASTFDFEWWSTFGSFLITASHEAQDVGDTNSLWSMSSGSFMFDATEDLTLDIGGHYQYVAPAAGFWTRFIISVASVNADEVLMFEILFGGPAMLEPPAATMTIPDTQLLLPAGDRYGIGYELSTFSHASGTDIVAVGDGEIHFTIQGIPEPATATLLLCTLPLLRHRRRK